MLAYFNKFKEECPHSLTSLLSVFIDTEKQVYEDFDGVKAFLTTKAGDSFANRKSILRKYLKFLGDNNYVPESDLVEMYSFLTKAKRSDYLDIQYFESVDDLYSNCYKDILRAENNCNAKVSDFSDLKSFFLMQWYGVDMSDFFSIRLSDINVSDKTIFVPSLERTISPDERVFNAVLEYRNKEIPSDTTLLYRPLRSSSNLSASLRNRRGKFTREINDKRYAEKNILTAGILYEIKELERKLNRQVYMRDLDSIVRLTGKSYGIKHGYFSIYHSIYGD